MNNDPQNALLARLRDIVVETPKSGAVNAGKRPLHITRFAQAVEARAEDGAAPTGSYTALVAAGRPDLTVEAIVADADAEWASEFTDADRAAARARLGDMIETHRKALEESDAVAVAHDRTILAKVSASRVAKGMPELTAEQETTMLAERSARRAEAS